jgi:hypothetical protein
MVVLGHGDSTTHRTLPHVSQNKPTNYDVVYRNTDNFADSSIDDEQRDVQGKDCLASFQSLLPLFRTLSQTLYSSWSHPCASDSQTVLRVIYK